MRIWIINHYALPPTTAGGTRHYNFARQLIARGHEVTIIAANLSHFTHTYNQEANYQPGDIDQRYVVPFIWIPTPVYKSNTIARFWNMLVFSWRLQCNKYLKRQSLPDVIIGSSPQIFAAFSAEILARRLKKPFVLEVRDLWPESLVDLGRFTARHPLIKMMKYMEQYLYRRAKKVISLLPSADKYLVASGVDPAHILWLPNAIDTDILPPATTLTQSHCFTVMYAGAHGVANDLDTLIAAAKLLQMRNLHTNIRICLVGAGPAKEKLQQRVRDEKITCVEFVPAVAKEKIYTVLNHADAFLMLLKSSPVFRWGISPNKLFDYLLMSRPVIFAVDTPFNPIEKYNAGISIMPSDPEALANAIHQLSLLSKAELAAMGQRGKEYVLQQHSVQGLTDALENLICEVAAG